MTLLDLFHAHRRVYLPGAAGEIVPAVTTLKAHHPSASFLGVWLPGVNLFDFAGLDSELIFPAGPQTRVVPLTYRRAWTWLAEEATIDLALIHVSPPDARGRCSSGVAADFPLAVAARAKSLAAIVNHRMPVSHGAAKFAIDGFDHVFEMDFPLIEIAAVTADPIAETIAGHVAGLIEDGDTIEYGLGRIPETCIVALRDRRRLSIHSGMITDVVLPLLDSGAVERITCGIAVGSQGLYARAAADERCHFQPVCHTHDLPVIARIPRFKAINSALEVDLLGQINAEFANGRRVSGVGGLHDFLAGACQSPGGLGIVALPATAQGGAVSRIVPSLMVPATVARHHVQIVVTEYGVADLRGLDESARARALIGIAAPAFQDALSQGLFKSHSSP